MPLRSVLALALVALSAAGCAGGQRSRFERLRPGMTSTSDRAITLTRGGLMDFELTLHGDGIVEIRGGGGAVRAVTEMWRIDAAAAHGVFTLADSLRFDELPPSIDPFCAFRVYDRKPLTRIFLRNGESRHVTDEELCYTMLDEIGRHDSVVVRGVSVPEDTFRSSSEMQQWARENEDRFIRESLTGKFWPYSLGDDRSPDSILAVDSLGRRYRNRLHRLADAIDLETGARRWAEAHQNEWARQERRYSAHWQKLERQKRKR